ncbi:MAG: hypothetical protein BGO70_05800 [Bacteroidetes bacterium 43-93]|nr:hypothetical protein [Bacteroidota bacterium]OJW96910.1 MAG: hypothetical protein BGO70_05800 [Bacteroidetes bacterium 43-93]
MKTWDHIFTAKGIPTDFFMDAQSEPQILSFKDEQLILKIECWNDSEIPVGTDYHLEVTFYNVACYQILLAELPHFTLQRKQSKYPPFIFEIDYSNFDLSKKLSRSADSWYPKVKYRYDPTRWYETMWLWEPRKLLSPIPNSKTAFLIQGHDTYMEILASNFSIIKAYD